MISIEELELVDNAFDGYHIPSKPDILTKIEQVLQAEEPDMMALADLVATDIGVSSVVLKTINAPFYGMRRTISEIKQAVLLLGMEVIRALVVGVILRRAYDKPSCISLDRFWDNTTDVANTMVFVGDRIKHQVPIEKLYTMGLFQNCAVPAFAIKYSNYKELLGYVEDRDALNIVDLEDQHYGTNHATMGYYIANAWGLPRNICKVILNHHDKEFLDFEHDEETRLLYATLKVSENVVNRVRRLKNTADWEHLGKDAMDILHIGAEEFDDILEDVEQMFDNA